jgi:hypothetical protein
VSVNCGRRCNSLGVSFLDWNERNLAWVGLKLSDQELLMMMLALSCCIPQAAECSTRQDHDSTDGKMLSPYPA